MLYMVELVAAIEKADAIDRAGGPGEMFAKINERFHPQSIWGDPTGRHLFMVVELESPADIAELMYVLTWFNGSAPRFTPLMDPKIYGEALEKAKEIVSP